MQNLMMALAEEVIVASGSACAAANLEISHVLQALKLPPVLARNTLRFSFGRFTTEKDIDTAAQSLKEKILLLRETAVTECCGGRCG